MKACIISFSGRENGNCNSIGKMLHQQIEDSIFYDFSKFILNPCGNCHLECFEQKQCPFIQDDTYSIYNSILQCDIAYFIVPNYCDYPCANFFIFNERSCCVFQHHPELLEKYLKIKKKFIVISNTDQKNFQQAFLYHSDTPDILFLSAKKYNKISIHGDLLESDRVVKEIMDFIKE